MVRPTTAPRGTIARRASGRAQCGRETDRSAPPTPRHTSLYFFNQHEELFLTEKRIKTDNRSEGRSGGMLRSSVVVAMVPTV